MKNIFILISFLPMVLFAQQRDSRTREYLSPVRVVWQQEGQLIQGLDNLLAEFNLQMQQNSD